MDTNVLVASAYNRTSASGRIVDAVEDGEFQLVVSPDVQREYERIIPKAVRVPGQVAHLRSIIAAAARVMPSANPPITEDREDDKFLAAALAGDAAYVITNDPHLLDVNGHGGLCIVKPSTFLERLRDRGHDVTPADERDPKR